MAQAPHDTPDASDLTLRRLLPNGEPITVERLMDELGLTDLAEQASRARGTDTGEQASHDPSARPPIASASAGADTGVGTGAGTDAGACRPAGRPYLLLNMVSTADGRATLSGRSGGLGDEADKELFHGLRTAVDAVMAGAGTVRAEHYHRLVRDERRQEIRRARGLAEEPLACVVSGRLALSEEIPLLADPKARVMIITASEASLPQECQAQIEYVRAARDGALDLPDAMSQLRERFDVRTLLCEGGPHLNSHLLAAGLVDELFLSLSPKLAGGDATSETLRILSGRELDPPVSLKLLAALEHDSHLFLRYRVEDV